jgi:hypothetical protein
MQEIKCRQDHNHNDNSNGDDPASLVSACRCRLRNLVGLLDRGSPCLAVRRNQRVPTGRTEPYCILIFIPAPGTFTGHILPKRTFLCPLLLIWLSGYNTCQNRADTRILLQYQRIDKGIMKKCTL